MTQLATIWMNFKNLCRMKKANQKKIYPMLYNAIDLNFLQWQHLEMENRPLVIRVREVVGSK